MSHTHRHGDGPHGHSHNHKVEGFLANLGAFLHLARFGHEHENEHLINELQASDKVLAIRTVWIALVILRRK